MLRSILLTMIFLVLMYWSLARPWLGIMVWSWFSYMNPHRMAYGFAYNFPFVAVAAGVTMFAWFSSREPKWFPFTRETVLEIFFTIWFTVTTLFGLNELYVWDYWNRAFKVQVMVFMTLLILRTRFHLEALIWTIVLSLGFFGVKGGIWTILTRGKGRVIGPELSFISDNNTVALALVMTLPLMRYLYLRSKNRWVRYGLLGGQVLTVLAVLSTYSRGGFLALGVVGVLMWFKSRHKLAFAVAALAITVPLIRFMPAEWKERMETLKATDESELDDSAKGRLNAWKFAINIAKARPLVGGGFHVFISPAFSQYAPDPFNRHDSHSVYFELLGEHGFPGLGIFLLMGVCTWLTVRKTLRQVKRFPELEWAGEMVQMVEVSLAGFAVGGALVGMAFFDLPYHLMAIIVLCQHIVTSEIRQATRRAAEAQAQTLTPAFSTAAG